MNKLTTTYLGLKMKSPVIVSSSRLTADVDHLISAEHNGAGAVVLKSLFEEQIMFHINELQSPGSYPEADDYITSYARSHSVQAYLDLIKSAKKQLSIPVIASINCYSKGAWLDFTRKIADAGADALEINAFFLPLERKMSAEDTERIYLDLAEKVVSRVKLPVVMKMSPRFSNILYMVDQFYMRGVKGVVMFNRFYEPDIDINKVEVIPAPVFSSGNEMRYVLRWIGMASAQGLNLDISASTGVTSGADVIKYLLAGADAVQVCSVLYQKGLSYIKTLNDEVEYWMKKHSFDDISDFRGMLNWKNARKPVLFERTQFMKYFSVD